MRKTLLTILGSAMIVASASQIASAAETHHVRHIHHAVTEQQFRNANNYWPAPYAAQWEGSRYDNVAGAPPVGH